MQHTQPEEIRAIFINNDKHEVMDIRADAVIENYAMLLGAEKLYDVHNGEVHVHGKTYRVLHLDNPKLTKGKQISVLHENGNTVARGNVLICNSGEFGNPISLTDNDCKDILANIVRTVAGNLILVGDDENTPVIVAKDERGNTLFN